jgi:ribosomal protein S3AE
MADQKSKTIVKKRKFFEVEIPLLRSSIELVGETINDLDNKNVKLDLTRQLRGKSVEAVVNIKIKDNKPVVYPKKITLMPYFIRRMIRKRISYVEDSFEAKTQESLVKIKPFIITRKKVSRVVRKTIRNLAKNWLEDYLAERTDNEIFNDILSNKLQKPLSLKLKKTYPLSLCEIRVLEIIRPLGQSEIPKIQPKKIIEEKQEPEIIDQLSEIEEEIKQQQIKQAEQEIKQTQEKAAKLEGKLKPSDLNREKEDEKTSKIASKETEGVLGEEKPKAKRGRKKKTEVEKK